MLTTRFLKTGLALSLSVGALSLSGAAMAEDKVPLAENAHIRDSLVAGRVADVLRTECGSLQARMLFVICQRHQQLFLSLL